MKLGIIKLLCFLWMCLICGFSCAIPVQAHMKANIAYSREATLSINKWANGGSPSTIYIAREVARNGRSK